MKLKKIEKSLLFEDLKNPKFAAGYLEQMLQEDDLDSFLIAINNVAKANGGIAKIAKNTKLGRESLYKALSENGNPYFKNIHKILKNMGFKISISVSKKVA